MISLRYLCLFLGSFLLEVTNTLIKKTKLDNDIKTFSFLFYQSVVTFLFILIFGGWHIIENHYGIVFLISLVSGFMNVLFYIYLIKAVKISDRSFFSIISILIIPMLIVSDYIFYGNIGFYEIVGMLYITLVFIYMSYSKTLNYNGLRYIIYTLILLFLGINIFKYAVTHYTNVFTQILLNAIFGTLIFGFFLLFKYKNIGFIKAAFKKEYIGLGTLNAVGAIIINIPFAYLPASIIGTLTKIAFLFFSIIFGKIIFNEKYFYKKLFYVFLLSIGIIIINFEALSGIFIK